MKRRTLAILLTAAMTMGAALTGCGDSAGDTSAESSSSDNTDTESSTEDSSSDTATEDLSGTITAAGSSALKPLADDAADAFAELYPDVAITIDAGGSGEGLKQVSEGTVDIGNSDVEASEKLDEAQAAELVDHQVCVITMAPIVNPDVKEGGVENLTKDQLISIFTGETKNWSEVGGPDEDIVLVTRPTSSGTRATFQK